MSTRQLQNLTIGALSILLPAAVAISVTTAGSGGDSAAQIDVALRQQMLVQDLTRNLSDLGAAATRDEVAAARSELGRTIVSFDQGLTALLYGGSAQGDAGVAREIRPVKGGRARKDVESAAQLWIDTGMPLSDLAAGEFSVFSAAGRQATAGLEDNHLALMQTMGDAAEHVRQAAAATADLGRYARWAAGLFAAALLVAVWARRRRTEAPAAASAAGAAADHETGEPVAARVDAEAPPRRRPFAEQVAPRPYASPVDFDDVNAAVDQMSVDMNTIAGSTDKMRSAIDSVGFALQGMLFSLREMAQDTAEGYKIVRGANNAASFTADAAEELAAPAREMSRVVARVTQLALRTKQVAAQIEGPTA